MSEQYSGERENQERMLANFISRLGWMRIRALIVGIACFIIACAIPFLACIIAAAAFGALAMSVAVFSGPLETFAIWLDHRLPRT